MSFGVECWNTSSQKTLELTSRVAKFFGVAQIGNSYTGSTTSGTITDSRFTAYTGTNAFYFVLGGGIDLDGNAAQISITGTTLTWVYPNPVGGLPSITRPDTTFAYGIL